MLVSKPAQTRVAKPAQTRRHYLHTNPGDCGYSIVLARYAHTNPHHMAPHHKIAQRPTPTGTPDQAQAFSLYLQPWKRDRLPDAKFEVTGAKCDLRNEQQREKREESREKREARREKREERSEKRETSTINMRGWKDAMVWSLLSSYPTLFCAIPPFWDRSIGSFDPLILIMIVSLFSLLSSLCSLLSSLCSLLVVVVDW